jgi:opacity protein-like surface antigen
MKKIIFIFTSLFLLSGLNQASALQIAPSPLIGPEFSKGDHKGRGEIAYISYDEVYGGGIQGVKRFALTDKFAVSPSLGLFHLTGDQTYTDDTAGKVEMDLDYSFITGGIRGEIQHKINPVNFIVFGGPLFHYGESESTTTSEVFQENDTVDSTDEGLGWEAGIQAALQTGPFTTTLFYRYEYLRVDTDNDDASGNQIETDSDQTFTFKSSTLGIDLLFENGMSLSALYGIPDDSDNDEITMIKAGFTF